MVKISNTSIFYEGSKQEAGAAGGLGIDSETGRSYEPARDPLSLEGVLMAEEEQEMEKELTMQEENGVKDLTFQELVEKLTEYDFRDSLDHPLDQCIDFMELCRRAGVEPLSTEIEGRDENAGREPDVHWEKNIQRLNELSFRSDRGSECLDMVTILHNSGFNGGEIKRAIARFWGIQGASPEVFIRDTGEFKRIFSEVLDSARIMEKAP